LSPFHLQIDNRAEQSAMHNNMSKNAAVGIFVSILLLASVSTTDSLSLPISAMTRSRSGPDRGLASSRNDGGDRDFTSDVGSKNVMALRGGGIDNINNVELKSYASEASNLFGNLRVPASLFAGASVGAAFAMPIDGPEGLKIGLVKRLYALLMISSLACQVVVVVVTTCTMGALALGAVEKT